MNPFNFSGHETFPCRQYWLKKGYDFIATKKDFNAPDAVVELGVGNNMVRSIRYWLRAFDLVNNNNELTALARRLFSDEGWDPFLEDTATLWLLQYKLHKRRYASIYHIIFSELRKHKPEFTRKHFFSFLANEKGNFTERTLRDDFSVFSRTYLNDSSKDVEDGYSGLLSDLNLLREYKRQKDVVYNIENKEQSDIPAEIILYSILDNELYGNSISFDNLYLDEDGPGTIFALNKEGLLEQLERIAKLYPKNIVFNNDPLIRQIQFKGDKIRPLEVLEDYYAKSA